MQDQTLFRTAPRAFAEKHGYQHREAFCLMRYQCSHCGHTETIWNSRDGVTPFMMACPSCGEPELQHVNFRGDIWAPEHKPHEGQRVWIDMTKERAEARIKARVAAFRAHGHEGQEDRMPAMLAAEFNDGQAPDLKVWGYIPEAT